MLCIMLRGRRSTGSRGRAQHEGKEGTERTKEAREAEGTRQGHKRGQKATDRGAGELGGLPCTVRATARGTGARGKEGAPHIVVYRARDRESEQRGAKG